MMYDGRLRHLVVPSSIFIFIDSPFISSIDARGSSRDLTSIFDLLYMFRRHVLCV